MATVFMKWLETSPRTYERGIRLLTLGRLERIDKLILTNYLSTGCRVLEIGCGTGRLASKLAATGAEVTAIDASPLMIDEARARLEIDGLSGRVNLIHLNATQIGERFSPASFDVIVASLVFSELPPEEQGYILESGRRLLAPGGKILIADEIIPESRLIRPLYHLIRWPLAFLTWLLTRASTGALHKFGTMVASAGFGRRNIASYLFGSLILIELQPIDEPGSASPFEIGNIPQLSHRTTLRTLLLDLWLLLFRIIPPYPRVQPGLYRLGQPAMDAPVLVTGNFHLTVRCLVKTLDGRVAAWLLVADSAGINVWCAAGGGYFTAEKIIAALKTARLDEVVRHRNLILPQLCANGVDGWRLAKESGWRVRWGPVKAEDIPSYLAKGGEKSDGMRWVAFPLKDRLEMTAVVLGFYGLMVLLPVLLIWPDIFSSVATALVALSFFYGIFLPWLPGRDGLYKSLSLTILTLGGLVVYQLLVGRMPDPDLFKWGVGLTGLSIFVAAEMQGMSPLMRGEQANWKFEAVTGLLLILVYWLVPIWVGWR